MSLPRAWTSALWVVASAVMWITTASLTAADVIRPGEPWLDDRGQHIQAHGGGIIKEGSTWFWFGEDRSQSNDPKLRYVACYASTDLVHWQFRGQVVKLAAPDGVGEGFLLERPKVYHNAKTGKYVMYAHFDAKHYTLAEVAVFTSDKVDGDYKLLKHFRPFGKESRDIGQFIDDDSAAYLIFESRPSGGFYIARLSEDYLNVAEETCYIQAPMEGGAVVHYDGLYYVLGSGLTSWSPNPNKYATAKSIKGPWSEFRDIAPPATNTYGSQSTNLLKVVGSNQTAVIFLGDIWKPKTQWDSRYLWMPLEIGAGKLRLPQPRPWSIDVPTGVVSVTGE